MKGVVDIMMQCEIGDERYIANLPFEFKTGSRINSNYVN